MTTAAEMARFERVARGAASDILAYNPDKIRTALIEDNFFEVMESELNESIKGFRARTNEEVSASNMFARAITDIIIATQGNVNTPIF
ncbi:MAG: hypothetical protein WC966_11030 [Bradymonadales bacterium]|jgi:hypothetical protein